MGKVEVERVEEVEGWTFHIPVRLFEVTVDDVHHYVVAVTRTFVAVRDENAYEDVYPPSLKHIWDYFSEHFNSKVADAVISLIRAGGGAFSSLLF